MLRYGMKAAVASLEQLADRVDRLRRLRLPLIVELHTTGRERATPGNGFLEGSQFLRRLQTSQPLRLYVHVPPQRPDIVTRRPFDRDQVLWTVDVAETLNAEGIILHRYYGLASAGHRSLIPKVDAEAAFHEEISRLIQELGRHKALVENLGFFWQPPRAAGRYLAGPLEHFFPWEIARFEKFLATGGIDNVHSMIDIAHATLSTNMHCLLRRHYSVFREDARFQGITEADLSEQALLTPYDFLRLNPRYLHISDAVLLTEYELLKDPMSDAARDRVNVALTSEGLPLGVGTLNFGLVMSILTRTSSNSNPVLIAEINPSDGQGHERNVSQETAIRTLRALEVGLRARV